VLKAWEGVFPGLVKCLRFIHRVRGMDITVERSDERGIHYAGDRLPAGSDQEVVEIVWVK